MKDYYKVAIIIIGIFVGVVLGRVIDRNTPRTKYNEQAEVVGKRVKNEAYDNDVPTSQFIIAFKFSDGSIKELRVSMYGHGRKVYDTFHEGDTGILVYTERENLEKISKKESEHWKGRRFISFEKDEP